MTAEGGVASADTNSPARHPRRAVLVALFVALTGPLIGVLTLLTFVLARTIAGMSYADFAMPSVSDVTQVIVFFSLFAYVFAGFSAIIAGLGLGWRTYTHGTFSYLFAMVVAVIATLIGTASLELMVGRPDQAFIGMTIFFTPLSIVAAVFGRWLMLKIGILPSIATTSLAQH